MSNFDDFFGGGVSGSQGLFPVFPPKRVLHTYSTGSPDGFIGNGDCIVLPASDAGAGNIQYLNNSGTVIWSKASTDVNPACNAWVTFNMDSVDNLLWVLAIATSTNSFYLATINSTGTIVVKGSAVATATLMAGTHGWVGSNLNRLGGSLLRDVQGAGNFTARLSNIDVVFNYTNGAIITESPVKVGYLPGMFKSTNGTLFAPGAIRPANGTTGTIGFVQSLNLIKPQTYNANRYSSAVLLAPMSLGLPYYRMQIAGADGSFTHLQWKGEVFLTNAGATMGSSPVVFDPTDYLNAVDTLVSNYRW